MFIDFGLISTTKPPSPSLPFLYILTVSESIWILLFLLPVTPDHAVIVIGLNSDILLSSKVKTFFSLSDFGESHRESAELLLTSSNHTFSFVTSSKLTYSEAVISFGVNLYPAGAVAS